MRLAPANRTAWNLFTEMMPLLFDGLGGVNAGMIEHFLAFYGISGWRAHDTLIKIAAIVAVVREKNGEQ